jgi:hypothetical protein
MGRAANFTAASRIFETGEVAVKAGVLIPPDHDDVAQRSSRAVGVVLRSATWRRRPPAVCAIFLCSRLRSGKIAFARFSRCYPKSPANASNNFLICGVGAHLPLRLRLFAHRPRLETPPASGPSVKTSRFFHNSSRGYEQFLGCFRFDAEAAPA